MYLYSYVTIDMKHICCWIISKQLLFTWILCEILCHWWYIVSWLLLGHAIKSVTCFDLQFWRSTRTMTSFCIFIAYINTGNSFQRHTYKMRLKQRSLNWINSMQVKKIIFTNVFFSLINMFVKYVSIDGIPQAFLSFRFVDIIVITVHDRFWNVGQANCILKYFENMMIDHSDSTIF